MPTISKIVKSLTVRDKDGNIIDTKFAASAVIGTGGTTAQQHFDDATVHHSLTERGYMTNAGSANGVALLDSTGHLPSGVFDSTKLPVEQSVADIAARDALTAQPDGIKVFVEDASADATVLAGWAIYRYRVAQGENLGGWTKLAEAESLDIIHEWANIQNRPVADADLTDAVTKRHAHTNSAVLDLLTTTESGQLQYNGAGVGDSKLMSKLVTEMPTEWPSDVRQDGILFLVDAI